MAKGVSLEKLVMFPSVSWIVHRTAWEGPSLSVALPLCFPAGKEAWRYGLMGVSLGVAAYLVWVQPGPLAITLWDSKLMGRNKGASSWI